MVLKSKIDFMGVIVAENCNPNGDPLNGNRPRTDIDGYGEMTDVCIKRKIRNRLQDMGEDIFVQMEERTDDGCMSLNARQTSFKELSDEIRKKKKADLEKCKRLACEKWIDVRAFGQVFAFKGEEATFNVRGPVSLTLARTIETVTIKEYLITKSANGVDADGKDSSTMGHRYCVDRGAYVFRGSIFPELAKKTGFSDEDAEKIKDAIITIMENDASGARPSGSMALDRLFWWEHDAKRRQQPSGKIFRSVRLTPSDSYPYYGYEIVSDGVEPKIYE